MKASDVGYRVWGEHSRGLGLVLHAPLATSHENDSPWKVGYFKTLNPIAGGCTKPRSGPSHEPDPMEKAPQRSLKGLR